MQIGVYIQLVHEGQQDMADGFLLVAKKHGDEPDIEEMSKLLASWSQSLVARAKPFTKQYSEKGDNEPDRLLNEFFKQERGGSIALLLDLQDLWLMANEANVSAIILRQAAAGLHDKELSAFCDDVEKISGRQISWLLTQMKADATQTLIVTV